MDIPAAAHQAASDHLLSTAKSNTGWLSDLRVSDIDTPSGTITSGSGQVHLSGVRVWG